MKVVLIIGATYGLVKPAIILNANVPKVVDDELGAFLLEQRDPNGNPFFEQLPDDIVSEVLGEAKGPKKLVIGKKSQAAPTSTETPPEGDDQAAGESGSQGAEGQDGIVTV